MGAKNKMGVVELVRKQRTQKTAQWGAAHDLFYFLIAASYFRFFIATILHHLPRRQKSTTTNVTKKIYHHQNNLPRHQKSPTPSNILPLHGVARRK